METTIKVKKSTKADLDAIKRDGESYDDAIARLIKKERIAAELKEGAIRNAERDLALCKEWEEIDAPWPE